MVTDCDIKVMSTVNLLASLPGADQCDQTEEDLEHDSNNAAGFVGAQEDE